MILSLFVFSLTASAESTLKDSHATIYTQKVKRIVNALNVGDFQTQESYFEMLDTACDRNQCNPAEKEGIRIVGREIVFCRLKHLKAHGISNPDANSLCTTPQAQLGCNTLPSPLLRKMCYTGNKYKLSELMKVEIHLNKRLPASK